MTSVTNRLRLVDALTAAAQVIPTVHLLAPDGTTTSAIVDSATPTVTGTAAPGSLVSIVANGRQQGDPVTPNANGTFSTHLTVPLMPGENRVDLVAVITGSAGTSSATSTDYAYVLPAPVNGVSTPDVTSLDVDTLLGSNFAFRFIGGTSTVRLTNGSISFGADAPLSVLQRLYEGLFGRAGDPGGLGALGRELSAGTPLTTLAQKMLDSPEYASKFGQPSADDFVTLLYRNFNHRLSDAGGRGSALAYLASGHSRAELAVAFAQAPEVKSAQAANTAQFWAADPAGATVTQLYETAYDRAPDPSGLAAFTSQIANGFSGLFLAQEIVSGAEFQARHYGQSTADLVSSLYYGALDRGPIGNEQATSIQAINRNGVASELYRLAASPEVASYQSPDIHPIPPRYP